MRLSVALVIALAGFVAGAGVIMATRHPLPPKVQAIANGARHSGDTDDWP